MAEATAEDFVFSGPLWFIVKDKSYRDINELCKDVMWGMIRDRASREKSRIVYAFSDRDLAERFIERGGRQASGHLPFRPANAEEALGLLKGLQKDGHRLLGIDAEKNATLVAEIERFIRHIECSTTPDS